MRLTRISPKNAKNQLIQKAKCNKRHTKRNDPHQIGTVNFQKRRCTKFFFNEIKIPARFHQSQTDDEAKKRHNISVKPVNNF